MLTTILTVGFIGIIIGASTHHEPHHGHHDHRTHVRVVQAAPPPVHRHNKKVVAVKSKPAPKKVIRKRRARKHRKR